MLAPARGAGLGWAVASALVDAEWALRVRWVPFTRDAHGLYEGLGFEKSDETCLIRPARRRVAAAV